MSTSFLLVDEGGGGVSITTYLERLESCFFKLKTANVTIQKPKVLELSVICNLQSYPLFSEI